MNPHGHKGRIGELLVALALEKMNIPSRIVNWDGVDILAYADQPIKIEVKARMMERQGSYKFKTNSEECDLYAFVALEEERIIFMHTSELQNTSIRIHLETFEAKKTETTWASAVEKVHEGHTGGVN